MQCFSTFSSLLFPYGVLLDKFSLFAFLHPHEILISQIYHISLYILYVYLCIIQKENGFFFSPLKNQPIVPWGQYLPYWECMKPFFLDFLPAVLSWWTRLLSSWFKEQRGPWNKITLKRSWLNGHSGPEGGPKAHRCLTKASSFPGHGQIATKIVLLKNTLEYLCTELWDTSLELYLVGPQIWLRRLLRTVDNTDKPRAQWEKGLFCFLLYFVQEQIPNVWDPVQKENMESLIKMLLRVSR